MQLTPIAYWLNTVCAGFDAAVATGVHSMYDLAGWFFNPFWRFVSIFGDGGIFLILLSLVLMIRRPSRRCGTAMLIAIAFGALVTNLWVKPMVYRPRPYTYLDIYYDFWLVVGQCTESDFCFPSGHTTAAAAAAVGFFLASPDRKKSWPSLFFPILMGISRIYLSVHYTTDVIGGLIVGGLGGVVGWFILRFLPESCFEMSAATLPVVNRLIRKRGGKHAR